MADKSGPRMRSIDIHAHYSPHVVHRALKAGGIWHGIDLERTNNPKHTYTVTEHIKDMDSLGVEVHVLSTQTYLYNYEHPVETAIATSREINDEISEMVKTYPDRLAGLGTLPMQDVPAAIAEMERAVGTLGLKGVMIGDQINGHTYDEPQYRPLFAAAEAARALIFFHQQGGESLIRDRYPRYHLRNTIGNPLDRTLTFATLVYSGVMDAHPELRICLAHAGGYVAPAAGRLDRHWQTQSEAERPIDKPPSDYLRSFYYDCLTHSEGSLRFLIDTVGADRVVFGTDWPADMMLDWPVSWLLRMTSITDEEKELILWKNLERLLDLSPATEQAQ